MVEAVTMHKAEKYAIIRQECPDDMIVFFMRNFGCRRKVYNLYTDFYYQQLENAGYTSGDDIPEVKLPEVTKFKEQYPYLKEADSLALANAKIGFEQAVERFREQGNHTKYTKRAIRRDKSGTEPLSFRGLKGMPKFKARARGNFSYTTNCQYPEESNNLTRPTIRLEGNMLHLPKLKTDIPLRIHRPLPANAVIGNVTVSMDCDGTLYASIIYSYTVMMDLTIRKAASGGNDEYLKGLNILGLDYSQQDFYVDSEGRTANYPHYYRKAEEKLAKLQRELSGMEKGSNNYEKQLKKIQRLHKKIRNQRKDFINKEAAYLSSTYDAVAVEDINLRAMGEGLSLGKNLHDNGFGMFREQLANKLEAKGSVLIKVDRLYPSTKTCSHCGSVNPDVALGVKEWDCPVCGTRLLRDYNAAVNIREEGRRIFADYFANWLEEDAASRKCAEIRSEGRKRKKKKQTAA